MASTRENFVLPKRPPTETMGRLVDDEAAFAGSPSSPSSPSSASHEDDNGPPTTRSARPSEIGAPPVVRLPVRPGLRVHFWYEGDELKCQATMLRESGELVWQVVQTAALNMSVAPMFSHFASLVVADIRTSGTNVEVPANQESSKS